MSNDRALGAIVLVVTLLIGIMIGISLMRDRFQTQCELKYGDMPANKVTQYCSELLKFK